MKTKSKIRGCILRTSAAMLLVSCMVVGFSSAINLPNEKAPALQNNRAPDVIGHEHIPSATAVAIRGNDTLTFADRVIYQRAIEEVYWRHRIWPKERPDLKPSLDTVMSRAQIEKKVQDYLRDSQALEDYWQKPITFEQLEAEMERMAQHTKQPQVLREIFQALGDDPFVIAECVARPVLAQRLVTELKKEDRVKLTKVAWLAQPFQSLVARTEIRPPVTIAIASANYTLPAISSPSGSCIDDTWTATSTTNAPSARQYHTAVWTGTEMIVWGGVALGTYFNTGGRYIAATDSWTATSTSNAPTGRVQHSAVWTGTEMIVWGGWDGMNPLNTGGRYDPGTDSWIPTTTTNAPIGRFEHTAVWTSSEMIIWGGNPNGNSLNTGGRYDPSTDSWIATSTTNAPTGRFLHTAVWTGSNMIVWGGYNNVIGSLNTGGRYDPSTDSWTATSTTNAPEARDYFTTVWTGTEMIIWGGFADPNRLNTGGRYDPGTDSWIATGTSNAPTARSQHTAAWTGSEMIIWGGNAGGISGTYFNTGGRYNPITDNWTATSTTNAPTGRDQHTAVWTATQMIIWGGYFYDGSNHLLNTGGRYCAQGGPSPTPTPTATASPTPTPTATPTSTPSATATATTTPTAMPRITPTPRSRTTPTVRPTPPPYLTPVPPPPSPRPTAVPRPTPPAHLTPLPSPTSPRPTPAPRP